MKNIITELYYGNIDPQARGFKKDSYLQKQMSILSKSEAELTDTLRINRTIRPAPMLPALCFFIVEC